MESDDIEPLIAILRTGIYHATSVSHYRSMLWSSRITSRSEARGISDDRPHLSNCWQLNAVSMFDFERPTHAEIYDRFEFLKWSAVLLWHKPTILIGFHRETLPGHIVYLDEAKERLGPGGIIPSVEICHQGAIPISIAFQCVVATHSPTVDFKTHYIFQTYLGHHIADDELAKWEHA